MMKRLLIILSFILIGPSLFSNLTTEIELNSELIDFNWIEHFKSCNKKHIDIAKFKNIDSGDTILVELKLPDDIQINELEYSNKFIISIGSPLYRYDYNPELKIYSENNINEKNPIYSLFSIKKID